MRRALAASVVLAVAAVLPGVPLDAAAAAFTPVTGVTPAGVVRTADGSMWVSNEFNGSISEVTARGAVVKTVTVPEQQITDLAVGSDGDVYVAGSSGLFGFDPATVTDGQQLVPTFHHEATTTDCDGTVGTIVAAGAGFMAFTGTGHLLDPNDPSSYVECDVLGLYDIANNTISQTTLTGDSYDIAYSAGKVWTAEDSGELERFGVSGNALVRETTIDLPDAAVGLAISGGQVLTAMYSSNELATVSTSASSGDVPTLLHAPFTIDAPHSVIVGADGELYLTDSDENVASPQGSVIRVNLPGTSWHRYPLPSGGKAWRIVQGTRADVLWVTDRDNRLLRFVSGRPVATTGSASAKATHATVRGSVDPRGEKTTVRFQYGKTAAYGSTTAAQTFTGVGSHRVSAAITGLHPVTTYHYRIVATNARGTTRGADHTFRTAEAVVHLTVSLATSSSGRKTLITRFVVGNVPKTGALLLTCKTPSGTTGCPLDRKRFTTSTGTVKLTHLFAHHKLPPKTTVRIDVTAPSMIGERITYTMRAHKTPRKTIGCLTSAGDARTCPSS